MIELEEEVELKKLVICIPVHGESDALKKSLISINEHVKSFCCKKDIDCILLISNSGQDINIDQYWQGELKVVKSPSSYYWGASVRVLFAAAKYYEPTHVLLMNHDILLTSTSFSTLVDAISENPKSVLSSISVVLDTKKVENAGFKYINNSLPFLNVYIDSSCEDLPIYPYQVDALNGRFVIFPSDAANPNYLKPRLVPHYFADTMLSVLARRAGFPLVVVPKSIIWSDQSDTEFKRARARCNNIQGLYNCLFKPYSYRYIWGGFWGQLFLVDNKMRGLLVSSKYTVLRVVKSVFELLGIVDPV
jgi:GT2 family glycosyltransferase